MSEFAGRGSDAPTLETPTRQRVVMLVNNPCTNDSRVIREAEALAQAGHEVTVLARLAPGLDPEQTINQVSYRRVTGLVEPWISSRQRQQAWRAMQRYRKAGVSGAAPHWGAKPLALLAYACTWRRNVRPQPLAATPATGQEALAQTPSVALAANAPIDGQAASAATASSARKDKDIARRVLGPPYYLARKILRVPWTYLRRIAIPIVIFEDVDTAMAKTLHDLRPTVIHAHDLITLPTAARIAKRLGARLVYDSHELELHRNAVYSTVSQWWRARMERRHIVQADLVVTVSDSIADHLARQYGIKRPLLVLNSPSFKESPPQAMTTLKTQLGVGPEQPLAVYVGRVTFGRGVEYCVQALVHDLQLHVAAVGPREAATEEKLRTLAADLGVQDRFHLVDPVAPDAVVHFIHDADVSLLPIQNVCLSYYYCMPNKLLESVMSGLPVAVADLVELRRFVEKNGCGAVMNETDPAAIARCVRSIFENRDAFRLPAEKIAAIMDEYGWETQAAGLAAAYARFGA